MKNRITEELKSLRGAIKSLDRKVVIIFIAVSLLQTISWYVTSMRFFRTNFYDTFFADNPNVSLYEYIYWFAGDFVTLFVCPVLIIKFTFKEKLSDYGINFKEAGLGFLITLIFTFVMVIIIWFCSSSREFAEYYPMLSSTRNNWVFFLVFQIFLLIFIIAWEFIWRGFMIFGLKGKFGFYAILIQMIPFVILHNGKPAAETFGAIAGGLALGILAYRTGSIFYGVIIHYMVMFMIDFLSIMRFKLDDFGTGINSLFHILSKIF